MNMGVNSPCFSQILVIPFLAKFSQTFLANFNFNVQHLQEPLFDCVVNYFLVFKGRNRTGRINYYPSHPSTVHRRQKQLFLNMRIFVNIEQQSVSLNRIILRYNAQTGARSVQQYTIKRRRENLWILSSIPTSNSSVSDSQPKDVILKSF